MHADFTSHDYAPHTHDAFVIAVTELGGAEISSRGLVEPVGPSVLFVSNPEERQSARMGNSQRWQYRSLYLARPAIDLLTRDLGIETVPYFTRNMFQDADLVRRFACLHRNLEAGQDSFLEHERLIGAFGELFRRYGSGGNRVATAPRDQILVGEVVEMMRAGYAESLRLETLARAVDMTSFQLIGLFKRTVGLTPHAYLIRIRLNMACRHLKRGDPLAQTASQVGFCDQSALTKHFKRWYGITPQQFADATRAPENGPATRRAASAQSRIK